MSPNSGHKFCCWGTFLSKRKKNIEHNFEIHILLLLTLFSSMKNDISSELFHAKALIVQQNQTHKINHCLHWNSGGKNSQNTPTALLLHKLLMPRVNTCM